jgi:hypothetical protein
LKSAQFSVPRRAFIPISRLPAAASATGLAGQQLFQLRRILRRRLAGVK